MKNENFEKQIYDLIDSANCNVPVPTFKVKKKKHFSLKVFIASLSTVCVLLFLTITLNNNTNSSKSVYDAEQNGVNNIQQDTNAIKENTSSFATRDAENDYSLNETEANENASNESNTILSSF